MGDKIAIGLMLEWYCNYLTILASTQLDNRLRRRVSPSDLVQETMMAAHRDFGDFRGGSERELIGWLRQILIHRLHHAIDEHVKAGKRDIRREVSMENIHAPSIARQPIMPTSFLQERVLLAIPCTSKKERSPYRTNSPSYRSTIAMSSFIAIFKASPLKKLRNEWIVPSVRHACFGCEPSKNSKRYASLSNRLDGRRTSAMHCWRPLVTRTSPDTPRSAGPLVEVDFHSPLGPYANNLHLRAKATPWTHRNIPFFKRCMAKSIVLIVLDQGSGTFAQTNMPAFGGVASHPNR